MASSSRAGWGWFSRSKPTNGGSTTNLAPTSPAPKVTNDQESLSVENTTMTSYETAMNASNTHEKVDTGTLTASANQDSLIDKSSEKFFIHSCNFVFSNLHQCSHYQCSHLHLLFRLYMPILRFHFLQTSTPSCDMEWFFIAAKL